jgi:hypothetical protein
MKLVSKQEVKNILGQIPLTAEAYWYLRQPGKPVTPEFNLDHLESVLPGWSDQVSSSSRLLKSNRKAHLPEQKRIFIFGTLRYWIEHTALLGMALAGMGHKVILSYLPYARWQETIEPFKLRQQNVYAQRVLEKAAPWMKIIPLLSMPKVHSLPAELEQSIERTALRDTQYTLQLEDVSQDGNLYQLRLQRNQAAARAVYAYFQKHRPDGVILPNGTILEFGVLYQAARFLGIPVVTYEFGEQHDRIWLAQDAEVMRQDTSRLWEKSQNLKLTPDQLSQVKKLFASRQRASLWENFARRWQAAPSAGGEQVRRELRLDHRPIVLLATNVIGDSLTLGRQVFSDSMTDWLDRTVRYFASRSDVQLVTRIHPGELITKGPSVADVVRRALPSLPENIHLIAADAKINTYDLVEIADLGLVYTTTVGMEMAMSGVPVIVVGNTHYRGKGFTLDPGTWEGYFDLLSNVLENGNNYRLQPEQVEQAWNYAYRFFFEYPHPFPWHLLHMWKDLETWPLSRLLSEEGLSTYHKTFNYLVGEPIDW